MAEPPASTTTRNQITSVMAKSGNLVILLACLCLAPLSAAGQGSSSHLIVSFPSDGKILLGYLYRPKGTGPFPAIIFHHGHHRSLTTLPASQYQGLADYFTSRGYLLFVPDRQIQGVEKSQYSAELQAKLDSQPNLPAVKEQQLHEKLEIIGHDVLASIHWLKQQPDVNTNRIVMFGLFSGAVQTLLAAPKDLNIHSYVVFSPGVTTWKDSAKYRDLLLESIRKSKAPIFLIFTENNQSPTAAEALGREVVAKGKPSRSKIYPAFGKPNEYGRLFVEDGTAVWGSDVLSFLRETDR